jgi:hypothetical protein
LISLVSDERIQGNPKKSNPQNRDFQSETSTNQETPNRPVGERSAVGMAAEQRGAP